MEHLSDRYAERPIEGRRGAAQRRGARVTRGHDERLNAAVPAHAAVVESKGTGEATLIHGEMILRDVGNLTDEDRMLIGQAVTQHGDGKHAAPNHESIGFVTVSYAREYLVRAREAGAAYPDKLATLGGRLLAATRQPPSRD